MTAVRLSDISEPQEGADNSVRLSSLEESQPEPVRLSDALRPASEGLNKTLEIGFTPNLRYDTGIDISPNVAAFLTTAGGNIAGSYRGAKQILGLDDGEEEKNVARLRALENDPKVGTAATVGSVAGVVADPVTWAVPLGKAKSLLGLAGYGAAAGGVVGALTPTAEGESRVENAATNAAISSVLTPALGKAINMTARGGAKTINALGGDIKVPEKLTALGTGDANLLAKYGIIKTPEEAAAVKPAIPKPVEDNVATLIAKLKADRAAEAAGTKQAGFADPAIFSFMLRPAVGAAIGYGLGDEEGAAVGAGVGAMLAVGGTKGAKRVLSSISDVLDRTVMNRIRENPIDSLAAASGAIAGWNTSPENATTLEKTGRGAAGMALAWLAYRGGKKVFPGMDDRIRGLVEDGHRLRDFPIYKELKIENKMFRNSSLTEFLDQVDESITKLTPAQRKLAYGILQGEAKTDDKAVMQFTEETRKLITKYGQMMVDTGLLNEETFTKNVANYIHREYLSKIDQTSKLAKAITNRIKLIGNELKPRGYVGDFKQAHVQEILANNPGATLDGKVRNGMQKIRFQLTKEQRVRLGEIEDVSYALARTGELMTNDIAAYKFFDDVSTKIASATEQPGWVQVPSTTLAKTKVNVYGNLAGKYVPENVMDDLLGMTRARRWLSGTEGESLRLAQNAANLYKKANTAWKISKTALNPVVHMNNMVSNNVLYDFADGTYGSLMKGAYSIRKEDELYRLATGLGVFDADFVSNELRANKTAILTDFIKTHSQTQDPVGASVRLARKTWGLTGGAMVKAYRAEDNIFRMGLFVERMKAGDTPEQAAMYAKRWLIDYDIDAPLINIMRHTTNPFISWSYRALPLITETAVDRPWKVAKWGMYIYALNALGEKYGGGDTERERSLMSERHKGTIFGLPFMPSQQVKLPTKLLSKETRDKIGIGDTPQYQDITRFVPGGDLAEVSRGQMLPGIPTPLQPSGGIGGSLAQTLFGYDAFKKKSLPGLGVSNAEDLKIKGKFLTEQLLPNNPAVPGSYSFNKIRDTVAGRPTPLKDNIPTWQAFAQGVGLKINPADISVMERKAILSAKQDVNALKSQIYEQRAAYNSGKITKEQMESYQREKVMEITARVDRLKKIIKRTVDDAELQ